MRWALGTASRQERSPGKTEQRFTDTKPRALCREAGTLTSAKGTGLTDKTPSKVSQESEKRRQTDRRPSRPRRRHWGTHQTQERDLTPARPESRRGGTRRERSPPALAATERGTTKRLKGAAARPGQAYTEGTMRRSHRDPPENTEAHGSRAGKEGCAAISVDAGQTRAPDENSLRKLDIRGSVNPIKGARGKSRADVTPDDEEPRLPPKIGSDVSTSALPAVHTPSPKSARKRSTDTGKGPPSAEDMLSTWKFPESTQKPLKRMRV